MRGSDSVVTIAPVYGYKELKSFYKLENGRLVYYSYSITYDLEGQEVSRTEPTAISSIGCEN